MNRTLAILTVLAALCACSGVETDPAPVELAELEQRIVMLDGYGEVLGGPFNQQRCNMSNYPWGSGVCIVPTSRNVSINPKCGVGPNWPSRCGSWNVHGVHWGLVLLDQCFAVADYLTARGWNAWCGTGGGTDIELDIQLGSSGKCNGNLATTSIAVGGSGEFRKFSDADIVVCRDNLEALYAANPGWSQIQKITHAWNIARHEEFHGAGLGHSSGSSSVLMAVPPSASWLKDAVRSPTSLERDFLEAYQP